MKYTLLCKGVEFNWIFVSLVGFWDMYDLEDTLSGSVLDECYDMELYGWTNINISDEAAIRGEPRLDAQCFKLKKIKIKKKFFFNYVFLI